MRRSPEAYVPLAQNPWFWSVLRTAGDPAAMTRAVKEALARADRNQAVSRISTIEELIGETVAEPRFRAGLVGAFAGLALLLIAQLYQVESVARAWTTEERLRVRQAESRPILDKLRGYLLEIQGEILPKSTEGRAVRYTLKNWTALNRFCEDGDLAIDNNATERAIRGIAVGRNNWVFFGSDEGGKTAAVLRSFTASCQCAKVDPFAWFKDVLSRIASHPITRLVELLPHNWAGSHA